MPVGVFTKDELATMILLSRYDISQFSPAAKLLRRIAEMDDKTILNAAKNLHKVNVVWERRNGELDLHIVYSIVMKVLLEPEDIVTYTSVRNLFQSSMNFLRRSKTTIFFKATDDYESFIIGFPLEWGHVYEWVRDEILDVVDGEADVESMELELSMEEYVMLLTLQSMFLDRLRKRKKTPRFKVTDIVKAFGDAVPLTYLTTALKPELLDTILNMMKNEELIYDTLDNMVERDLLKIYRDGSEVGYSKELLYMLDPRKILDVSFLIRVAVEEEPKAIMMNFVLHRDKILRAEVGDEEVNIKVYDFESFDNEVLRPTLR